MDEKIKKFTIELLEISPMEKKFINRGTIMLEIFKITKNFVEEYTEESDDILAIYHYEICSILTLGLCDFYKYFMSLSRKVDEKILEFLKDNLK